MQNEKMSVKLGKETLEFDSREQMERDLRSRRSTKWRGLNQLLQSVLDPNYVHPKKIRQGQ